MDQQLEHNPEGRLASDNHVAFALDLTGNFRSVSETAVRLTGYNADEFARLNVLDLVPAKSQADLRALVHQSLRRRFGTVFEVAIRARDGRQFSVEVSINLVRRADGSLEFRGIAVASIDAISTRFRPRCLDNRFHFKDSQELQHELPATL